MKRNTLLLLLLISSLIIGCTVSGGGGSAPTTGEAINGVPDFPREFRGAWSACIYNIDWPRSKGLSASQQKSQLIAILNKMESLKMNAIIFQVRPQGDAVYKSSLEPWSSWLTGTMGRSPGYDPLQFCIEQAHARGIEVHAWFNPFRALPNVGMRASANHVSNTHPAWTVRYGDYLWMDISNSQARAYSTRVITDVVNRYDIDGVHLDDYFYPYPKEKWGDFPDGKSPSARRNYVNSFVKGLYHNVKAVKPWVRVGISPFGIWRPGVPASIEASTDAYEDLAADSRKWLKSGWVDYLMPQLYWRDSPQQQSFSTLLNWWRGQGSRPVWPGIATARINGNEDRRPASEIHHQVGLSRKIGKNWIGHAHWSVKSLMHNRGGVNARLSSMYQQPALVPPMPWKSNTPPLPPSVSRSGSTVTWNANGAPKVAIQIRQNGQWMPYAVLAGYKKSLSIPYGTEAVAIRSVDRYGTTSAPIVSQ